MKCLISIFGTVWGTGYHYNQNPGTLSKCAVDIFTNTTDHDIQHPGMLGTRKIGQVDLVRCTNDWHNCRSSRKLVLSMLPPIACVHLAVYMATV
jgi:hypothetical protein